jgi:hypothetical protein
MKIYIVANKKAGKEILGSKWFDGGPFYHKKWYVWFNISTINKNYDNEYIYKAGTEFDDNELLGFFKSVQDFCKWMGTEGKKCLEDFEYCSEQTCYIDI